MSHTEKAAAFLESIAPHMLRLVAYARHVIGRRGADAEELLHEALLTCHRRIGARGFSGEDDAMVGYLYQQIRYQFQCERRAAARHPTYELPGQLPDLAESQDSSPIPVGPCPDAVHTYLQRHYGPDDVQIWEYHLAGVTLEETAFVLSMTKSTVHRHLEKIRTDLRREFRAWEEEADDE